VPRMVLSDLDLGAVPFEDALRSDIDCAVITTNHKDFDYHAIVARMPLVVDTRNVLKGMAGDHIFRL